jgi:hypothetical protein
MDMSPIHAKKQAIGLNLPAPKKLFPTHPYLSLLLSFVMAIGFSPLAAVSNFAFAGAIIIGPSLLFSIIATLVHLPDVALPERFSSISLNENGFIKIGFILSLLGVLISWLIEFITKGKVRLSLMFMRLRVGVIFIGWTAIGVLASLSAKPADFVILFFFVGLAVFFTVVTLLDYMVGYARSFL